MVASDLVVLVRAKTDKLGGDLNKAKGQFTKLTASFGSGGLFGKIVGGAATGNLLSNSISTISSALKQFAKGEAEAVDGMTKMSYQMNTSTESMQALQWQAMLAGADFDQLQKGMIKLRDNVVQAASGNDTAAASFATLGLSAQSLMGLSIDEQFGMVAEAVKNMGGSMAAQSAVIDIFGNKIGPRLYSMLMEGADGIKNAKREIEDLGLTFSNVEGNQVESMNDALERVTGTISGFARALIVEAAPALEWAANAILNFVKSSGGIRQIIDDLEPLARAGFYIGEAFYASFKVIQGTIVGIAALFARLITVISEVGYAMGLVSDETRTYFAVLENDLWKQSKNAFADIGQMPSFDNWKKSVFETSQASAVAADSARRDMGAFNEDAMSAAKAMKDISPSGEALKGTKEAYSAIAKAQRDGAKTDLKAIEKNGRDQVGVLRKIDASINKIAIPQLGAANL